MGFGAKKKKGMEKKNSLGMTKVKILVGGEILESERWKPGYV